MTDTVLITGGALVLLALGITFGILAGRAWCRHHHPRHWSVNEPLPYTPDDDDWFPVPYSPPAVVDTRVMSTYVLPARSCLAESNTEGLAAIIAAMDRPDDERSN